MSITYLETIREAQAKALREDPRVYIYGQDTGAFVGAFNGGKPGHWKIYGAVLISGSPLAPCQKRSTYRAAWSGKIS